MNSATSVKFDAGHRAVVVLLGLGAILVLALARMPLLKLYWQRATSVVSSCVCYLAQICANISTAKGNWVRITTWDSHQLAGYKMVLSRDHVVQKRWSCEVVGSDQLSQGDPGFCWGRSGFNWLLIWHFMNSGTSVKFDASHHTVVVLLGLGAILVYDSLTLKQTY